MCATGQGDSPAAAVHGLMARAAGQPPNRTAHRERRPRPRQRPARIPRLLPPPTDLTNMTPPTIVRLTHRPTGATALAAPPPRPRQLNCWTTWTRPALATTTPSRRQQTPRRPFGAGFFAGKRLPTRATPFGSYCIPDLIPAQPVSLVPGSGWLQTNEIDPIRAGLRPANAGGLPISNDWRRAHAASP